MTIWEVIKSLRFSRLRHLLFLALKHPVMVYPTLKATAAGYQIAKKEFPETHGKKGKGNAFRHALWNALICYECYKWRKNKIKVIAWAKIITDKHEELYPNQPLDTAMDLHNNNIGREMFRNGYFTNVKEIVEGLKVKLGEAKHITFVNDVEKVVDELVYITHEK